MSAAIRYAARLPQVQEVSLRGSADLDFWTARLQREDLTPAPRDGRAQILTIAADAKYLGLRFRELSFSVLVAHPKDPAREAAFLVQAFNSRRAFAFCERFFFSTPYDAGDVRVAVEPPAVELRIGGRTAFCAVLGTETSPPRMACRTGEEGWHGPIYLPRPRSNPTVGKKFYAIVRGETRAYPFDPARDSLVVSPDSSHAALQALADSGFTGVEWSIRPQASHAKSKTYARSFAGEID